jgi:hypothetical protein
MTRTPAAPRRVALALLAALALVALLATLPLSLLSRQLGNGIVAVVIGVPCAAVGVLVARRQPGNPLGPGAGRCACSPRWTSRCWPPCRS